MIKLNKYFDTLFKYLINKTFIAFFIDNDLLNRLPEKDRQQAYFIRDEIYRLIVRSGINNLYDLEAL